MDEPKPEFTNRVKRDGTRVRWVDSPPVGVKTSQRVIVCLCGSTRFHEAFKEAGLRETLAGKIVLSIGCNMRDDEAFKDLPLEEFARVKNELDLLHLDKIELADEVLILNVNGYIGLSTAAELAFARSLGKRVRFFNNEPEYTVWWRSVNR